MYVFLHVGCFSGSMGMEHRLQINDGAVAAAEFVELSEFSPFIEIGGPQKGSCQGLGKGVVKFI